MHLPWSFHVRAHRSCVMRNSNCSPSYLLCPAFDFIGLLASLWSLLIQTEEFYIFNPTPFGSCSVTLPLVILWVISSSSLLLSDEGSSTSPSAQALSAMWDNMKQYSDVFLFPFFFSPIIPPCCLSFINYHWILSWCCRAVCNNSWSVSTEVIASSEPIALDLDWRLFFHVCITWCLLELNFICRLFVPSPWDAFVAFYRQLLVLRTWMLHSQPASPVHLCGLNNPGPCTDPSEAPALTNNCASWLFTPIQSLILLSVLKQRPSLLLCDII